MSESSETIADLFSRVGEGDEDALAELLRQYEPKIRLTARYLLRPILRRYLDSIDVAQSVQCQLMRGLRCGSLEFSNPETFLALSVTIVRRKVAQHWRHLQQEHRFRFGTDEGHGPSAHLPLALPPARDPAQSVQLRVDLQSLWENLLPVERQLLELRLQGYSTEEAAVQLGCAANVLRVRLSRLRKRLQERGYQAEWF